MAVVSPRRGKFVSRTAGLQGAKGKGRTFVYVTVCALWLKFTGTANRPERAICGALRC